MITLLSYIISILISSKRPMRSSNKGSDTVPHEIGPGVSKCYYVLDTE